MNSDNQQSIEVLNAIAKSVDMLHAHGYKLYINTHSESWTNQRNITVGGKPFFFIFGNGILPSSGYALIFAIKISWEKDEWEILAEIERETYGDMDSLETLWTEKYYPTDFENFLVLLLKATEDLIQETSSEWFYSQIKTPK
jgi:hypothetical protein